MNLRQQGIEGIASGGGVGHLHGMLEGGEGGGCLTHVTIDTAEEVMGMDTVVVGAVMVKIVGELADGVKG